MSGTRKLIVSIFKLHTTTSCRQQNGSLLYLVSEIEFFNNLAPLAVYARQTQSLMKGQTKRIEAKPRVRHKDTALGLILDATVTNERL